MKSACPPSSPPDASTFQARETQTPNLGRLPPGGTTLLTPGKTLESHLPVISRKDATASLPLPPSESDTHTGYERSNGLRPDNIIPPDSDSSARHPSYTIASRSHKDFASALVINRAGRQCMENVTRSRSLGEVPIPDKYRQPWCIIRRAAFYGSKRCTLCGRKSHKGGESPVVRVRLIKTYKCSPCIWIAELPKWLHEIIKKKILPWDHSPGDRGQRRTPTGVHIGAVNESASVWAYPLIRRRRKKQRVVVVLEIVPWEIARRREDTNAKNLSEAETWREKGAKSYRTTPTMLAYLGRDASEGDGFARHNGELDEVLPTERRRTAVWRKGIRSQSRLNLVGRGSISPSSSSSSPDDASRELRDRLARGRRGETTTRNPSSRRQPTMSLKEQEEDIPIAKTVLPTVTNCFTSTTAIPPPAPLSRRRRGPRKLVIPSLRSFNPLPPGQKHLAYSRRLDITVAVALIMGKVHGKAPAPRKLITTLNCKGGTAQRTGTWETHKVDKRDLVWGMNAFQGLRGGARVLAYGAVGARHVSSLRTKAAGESERGTAGCLEGKRIFDRRRSHAVYPGACTSFGNEGAG
ncbi:hypothetical protein EV421DRAFT_1735136 [Armillaria borealis]|uniref:Uncharacterized protein n=1 Tax=Armillaria borealis TaxID=47425 RepID=A0AA39JKH7_9AGAR|nr:hypothetical protein EV421DRAFT_1735136 [Armillaria borealis]